MVVYDLQPGRETVKRKKGTYVFIFLVIEVFFNFYYSKIIRFYKFVKIY